MFHLATDEIKYIKTGKDPRGHVILSLYFQEKGNGGLERLSDMPKVMC